MIMPEWNEFPNRNAANGFDVLSRSGDADDPAQFSASKQFSLLPMKFHIA